MLGALTVTRLLASGIVTAHLGMALLLVAGASAFHQGLLIGRQPPTASAPGRWQRPTAFLAAVSLVLVFAQCLLGAAMASRWAASQCIAAADGCQWLFIHRLVAYPAAALVLALGLITLVRPQAGRALRLLAGVPAALVLGQLALGVATLRLQLSIPAVTVAHQVTAALLVALLSALVVRAFQFSEVRHG